MQGSRPERKNSKKLGLLIEAQKSGLKPTR